jgi:hypothetical protein
MEAETHFLQERLHFESDGADVGPGDARARIEIHPQFVRMVEVVGSNGMRMELDAAQIDDPGQPRCIIDD